jgi:alkylation response protein AidB-like acyl-CoA dehydrogenase
MTDLAREPALGAAADPASGSPSPEAPGFPPTGGPTNGARSTAAFRAELRGWLARELTDEVVRLGQGIPEGEDLMAYRRWNRRLADAGWAAPAWPTEHGGRDAGIDEQLAYLEEMSAVAAPGPINSIGVANIAPAIMTYGTPEQKQRFLRPLLRGDEIWSQGMSEPDAGSDLASLRTSAVADGDEYVVNGQKTWNSLGQIADWCQLYVRTDPDVPKHKGISCFLVDLRTPGIEVRPVRTITGDLTFSELFFSDVRIPASAALGPIDSGWTVAMTTLSFERAGVARLHLGLSRKLDRLLADPRAAGALTDPRLRDRVASIYADIACMRWMTNRSLARMRTGQPTGADGSMTKLAWGRAEQRLSALALDLLGLGATTDEWATNLAASRQATIAGGTTEINLNIVGEMGLGLPREPQVR